MGPVTGLAIATGASGLVQGLSSVFGQRSSNKTNIQLAREQRQWDLDMWNRQNEYNNPKNQMLRLSAAGLNPNLVYGSGSVSGNVTGSPPKASVARVENVFNFLPFIFKILPFCVYSRDFICFGNGFGCFGVCESILSLYLLQL